MNTLKSCKVHEVGVKHPTIGAVPFAINTGAKYMLFRPFTKIDIAAYERFHKYANTNFTDQRHSINEKLDVE